jgi:hypothetical protein
MAGFEKKINYLNEANQQTLELEEVKRQLRISCEPKSDKFLYCFIVGKEGFYWVVWNKLCDPERADKIEIINGIPMISGSNYTEKMQKEMLEELKAWLIS